MADDLKCSNPRGCIDPETCRAFGNGRGCAVSQTGAELLHCVPPYVFDLQKPELTEPDWPT